MAKYSAAGVHTVLVTCTGGEAGEILNPAMDRAEVLENLHAVRMDELRRATDIIGYDEVVLLGYRDSGMPATPFNEDPACFAKADLDEAVGRLVAIIRRTRPQVIITYGDDQQGYPHPDHLRVHDITLPAFEKAADPEAYPEAGEPWQPLKMYYSAWSRARMLATHDKFVELGLKSPYDEKWFDRPSQDDRITTKIDIADYNDVRREALLAHATQIDPESPFWFGLPPDVSRTVYPIEDWVLARSLVDGPSSPQGFEDDIFAGIRETADR